MSVLRALAWLVLVVRIAAAQVPPTQAGIAASPADAKLTVRVGETVRFRLEAAGDDLVWRWTLDARPVGSGPQWSFVPSAADVGSHEVGVAVTGSAGTLRRRWEVRVTEPRPPRIVQATPATEVVVVEADATVRLRLRAAPAGRDEDVRVAWTVGGVQAGDGELLQYRATRPGVVTARAVATGSLGATVSREWRITVTARPTTTTTLPAVARPEPAPRDDREARDGAASRALGASTPPPRPVASPPAVAPPTIAPAAVVPPPARGPAQAAEDAPAGRLAARPPAPAVPSTTSDIDAPAVRALLDRYAAAWSARDVGELQRLGQVSNDAQATALRRYFDEVGDLDVEIDVLDIVTEGDRATVRFRRRDRFRNPAGELTTQQSPPIEKPVVRTPDGRLRFGPPAR